MKEGYRIDPQTRCEFAVYHAQVVAVLCQAIFNRLGCKVPAANRWFALFTQALGLMCHGILHKVVAASSLGMFKEELAADMDDPNQSYEQYCAGKERQATYVLTDFPENVILLANAVVTSEPLDKLSNRLWTPVAGLGKRSLGHRGSSPSASAVFVRLASRGVRRMCHGSCRCYCTTSPTTRTASLKTCCA